MQDSRAGSHGAVAQATSGELDRHGGEGHDAAGDAGDDAVLDDVLVEDVSIDGMCGVY